MTTFERKEVDVPVAQSWGCSLLGRHWYASRYPVFSPALPLQHFLHRCDLNKSLMIMFLYDGDQELTFPRTRCFRAASFSCSALDDFFELCLHKIIRYDKSCNYRTHTCSCNGCMSNSHLLLRLWSTTSFALYRVQLATIST